MLDASTKTYSLSETAQIVGVDEKQLHVYAHKGLMPPISSTGSSARYSQIDCVRLKIIKRADDLGYDSENIFKLIGYPDEVHKTADAVSACQRFAMEKYKQIYEELNQCEPLEQLNRQCDLKLIKSYINLLKELQKDASGDYPQQQMASQGKPKSSAISDRAVSQAPKPAPAPTPLIREYSVAKFWDYMKKVELREKDATPGFQPHGAGQRTKPPSATGGDWSLSKAAKQVAASSPYVQRILEISRWSTTAISDLRKMAARQSVTTWALAGLIIIFVAAGYLLLSNGSQVGTRLQEDADKSKPQSSAAENDPGRPAVKEPAPAPIHDTAEDQRPLKPIQTAERQLDGQVSETGTKSGGDSVQAAPGKEAAQGPARAEEPEQSVPDQQSATTVAAVEPLHESAPPAQTPDSKPAAPVQVEDFSLWHDALNNIFRADFNIFNNNPANDREPLSGYVFIHLETGGEAADPKGLLLPAGDLDSGIPDKIKRGARFSIRNMKEMRVTAFSTLPPGDVTSSKVLVFSPEGDLLLSKPFNTPIQPYFSTDAEPPVSRVEKGASPSSPVAEIQPEFESRPQDAPGPQATDPQAEVIPPVTDKPEAAPTLEAEAASASETGPPAKAQAASGGQAQPTGKVDAAPDAQSPARIMKQTKGPAENVQPIAIPEKTGHPEAAVWEQKSYDAAVKGEFDRAIADATKAIELDPGRVNPYVNRSWAYIEKDMLAQAIQDCNTVILIDSRNAFAYNNRGLAHQRKADMQKAQDDYRKSCEIGLDLGCQNLKAIVDQARISALIDQSQLAFGDKDWDGVIRAATEVINLDPHNAVAYTNRSAAYAQKNDLNRALKDSNDAITHNPDFSLAYNNRGYVFELLGNNKKAAADYLKSCSLGLDLGCKNIERLNRPQ